MSENFSQSLEMLAMTEMFPTLEALAAPRALWQQYWYRGDTHASQATEAEDSKNKNETVRGQTDRNGRVKKKSV